jgi:hypothetical protein
MSLPNVLHSSLSAEWYTPSQYIEAVKRVFQATIGLDPASSLMANQTVQAEEYFTEAEDGLSKPWKAATVFLNPPYGKTEGRSNQDVWSERMIAEHEAGNFTEGILLVNSVTDRKWFQRLWQYPICFTNHRIKFYNPAGVGEQPTHGNAFVYFGDNIETFIAEFRKFGVVVTAINNKESKIVERF